MRRSFQLVRHAVLLATLAFALSACGSGVQFVRSDMTEYAPKPSDAPVEIHRGMLMRPHVVIGTMRAEQTMKSSFNDKSTYDEVIASLKVKARKVGADALIEVKPVTDEGGGMSSRVQVTAVAVRFMEQDGTLSSRDSR